jgi:drug/metabolite transporter (DMT)-like permease
MTVVRERTLSAVEDDRDAMATLTSSSPSSSPFPVIGINSASITEGKPGSEGELSSARSDSDSNQRSCNPFDLFGPCVVSWFSMILAVLSGAAIGPVFKYLGEFHVQPCMSASWRGQAMLIFLIPLTALETFCSRNHVPLRDRWLKVRPDCSYPAFVYVVLCGFGWSGSLLLWILGLRFTSTVKASILAVVHPLMLVIYLKCVGKPVSKMEWVGVVVVIAGLVISSLLRKSFSYYLHPHHHFTEDATELLIPLMTNSTADEIVSDTGLFQAGLFLSSLTGSSVHTFQSAFVSKILAATSVDYEVVGGVTNCSGAHCDVSLLWELFGDVLCLASAACQATTIIARNKIHDEDFSLLMVSSAY